MDGRYPGTVSYTHLLDTYGEYTGKKAEAICIGGGTYARKFKHAAAFAPHEENPDEPA